MGENNKWKQRTNPARQAAVSTEYTHAQSANQGETDRSCLCLDERKVFVVASTPVERRKSIAPRRFPSATVAAGPAGNKVRLGGAADHESVTAGSCVGKELHGHTTQRMQGLVCQVLFRFV